MYIIKIVLTGLDIYTTDGIILHGVKNAQQKK